MARDLYDRVLVVTGASSGIGAATAIAAAKAGMHVTLAARRAEKLMKVARQVADLGRKAHFFTCNVANPADVQRLFRETWDRFGRVDAVLANAGYGLHREAHATPITQHRAIFDVNYFGTLYTLKEALRNMERTTDGLNHLLVTTSCLSEMGAPMHGAYSATKAAQDCLAQAMRAELYGLGYDVTTIHPITTATEFFEAKPMRPDGGPAAVSAQQYYRGPFVQSAEHVARKIVKALRRPKAEVWPAWWSRYAFATATAFPGLTAFALRKAYARNHARSDAGVLPAEESSAGVAEVPGAADVPAGTTPDPVAAG